MQRPEGSLISFFSNLSETEKGINLAQGIPGFAPPEELLDILNSIIYSNARLHQYAPGRGYPELVDLIISELRRNSQLGRDNILITQGATEAINLVFFYLSRLIGSKFTVLSFDPPYESYTRLSEYYNLNFKYFDLNDDLSIDFIKLEKTVTELNVKLIVIGSPGNPLGKILSEDELNRINDLSRKYDIFVLFDAVYKDIYFHASKPADFQVGDNPNIFYVDSFSKMLSITGWRIGYLIADYVHMKEIFSIHDYTGLSAPYIFQCAVRDYLSENNFGRDYTEYLRNECKKSMRIIVKSLNDAGLNVYAPDGGYFIWAKIPEYFQDGFEFALELFRKQKVAVVPGENFSPFKKDFIRINFAQKTDIIFRASTALQKFIYQGGE